MSNYAVYFSPTRSTERVTKLLANEFGSYGEIDLSRRELMEEVVFEEQDLCIFGVPSYGGRVPADTLERMRGFQGNQARAVLVVTYGNRAYDDTFLEFQEFLEGKDFQVIAAVASVTEHSIMHRFAKGRPDENDKKELIQYAQEIKEKLSAGRTVTQLKLPGNRPYREYNGVPLKPSASRKCIECGICSRQCPVGAIPVDAPKETKKDQCISCMRCVSICPKKARKVDPFMLMAATHSLKKKCAGRKENELFIMISRNPE